MTQTWYFEGCADTQIQSFQIRFESFSYVVLNLIYISDSWPSNMNKNGRLGFHVAFAYAYH